MRKAWINRYLSFLYILLSCALFSCKDVVEETPSFIFAQPKNDAILWNTVSIDLTTSSKLNGQAIELFLNDSLIGTLTQFPYQLDVNTKSIRDGDYTLKAVSSNSQINTQIKISIRNTLLEMEVDKDQLPPGTRGFIFLSDKEGGPVATREFKNGEQIKITTDYLYDNFTLSEVYINGTQAISLYSFQEIPRGHWTLLKKNDYPALINNIGLDFTDISSAYYYISSSGDSEFLYGKSSMDLSVSKTPTKLFVREFNNPVNRFKIVNDLDPSNRQTISLLDVNEPLSIESIPLTGATNKRGSVRLFGFPTANNFQEYYNLGTFYSKNGVVKIEYPGSEFPAYGSVSFYEDNLITINSFQFNHKSDLRPLNAEVAFKGISGLSASISTFGEVDIYTATWGYFNERLNSSAYWAMIGPPGRSQTVSLPELPAEVRSAALNVSFNELQFSNTLEVSNFEIATDYASYVKYVSQKSFAGPYAFGHSWKEQIFTKSGSTQGRSEHRYFKSLSDRLLIK